MNPEEIAHLKLFSQIPQLRNKYKKALDKNDFSLVPLLTRSELTSLRIQDCPKKPYSIIYTSGTTAKKRMNYKSKQAYDNILARISELFNLNNVPKEGSILILTSFGQLQSTGELLYAATTLYGITPLPFGDFSEKDIPELNRIISEVRPEYAFSYSNQIDVLFKNIANCPIKTIFFGGEMLVPEFRQNMEKRYNIKTVSTYGCSEAGLISAETPATEPGIEVCLSNLLLEVKVNDNILPYGTGRLLITDFSNKSSPIIRYDVGDIVTLSAYHTSQKKLVFHGRADTMTNINDELIESTFLVKKTQTCLETNEFVLAVRKSSDYSDMIVLYSKTIPETKKSLLRSIFSDLNIKIAFKTLHNMPKTDSGKFVHFIDTRKKLIPGMISDFF